MYQEYKWDRGLLFVQSNPIGPWVECSEKQTVEYLKDMIRYTANTCEDRETTINLFAILGE